MAEKSLIVYYSRTGLSKRLAEALRAKLGCDIDNVRYAGRDKVSFAAAGLEAVRKATSAFAGDAHDASKYDRIFFISPVWAGSLATPIRSYMAANKDKIKAYALLATCGGSGLEGVKKDAQAATGKAATSAQQFLSREIRQGAYDLEMFTE
jgi:flavodoxin